MLLLIINENVKLRVNLRAKNEISQDVKMQGRPRGVLVCGHSFTLLEL